MRRAPLFCLALALTAAPALAQDKPLTTPALPQAAPASSAPVPKDTTPQEPAGVQPTLPAAAPPKPGSPVVEQMMPQRQALTVRKATRLHRLAGHRGHARHYARAPYRELDRPALAGVELLAPLPPPGEPPHVVVPTPAYPLESLAAAFTTPPPPIVCHPTRRDPDLPDPRLYREVPVECVPDNP